MKRLAAEVCVLGGGPAGSAAARRLAMLGHSVVLIEKAPFPRPHIGESLQGGILPLLDVLHLRNELEQAGFLRSTAALIRWSGPAELRDSAGPPGFQVDRSRFDQIMLNGAKSAGVQVFQPARAIEVAPGSRQRSAVVVRDNGRNETCLDCDFLIDATGRASVLGGPKRLTGAQSIALYTYFRNTGIDGSETRVEAGRTMWFWGAPLPQGLFNATVFLDNHDYKPGVAGAGSLDRFFHQLIASSSLLGGCLRGTRTGNVQICDATCAADDALIRDNVFKCGESAFTIDPLSSQGVQTAIGSALHVAAVLHTILRRPADAAVAREFYVERLRSSVMFHADAAARLYAEAAATYETSFWMRRTAVQRRPEREPPRRVTGDLRLGAVLRVHPKVTFKEVPVIEESFVTTATAVLMPDLPDPIVFLDGVKLAPLIRMLHGPTRGDRVIDMWTTLVARRQGMRILDSVFRRGIICPAET